MMSYLHETAPKLAKGLEQVYLYRASLMEGLWLSVKLGVASLLLALILGAISALMSISHKRVLNRISFIYTSVIRGIPDIVLIFLFFYGIQELLNLATSSLNRPMIYLSPFISGVITIGVMFGAFISETFRAAIIAVPKGQMEAATALGMRRGYAYRRIIFPQAMLYALPGLSNNWLVMLKATALVSLVGLKDIVGVAGDAGGAERNYMPFMLAAGVGYLLFTIVSIVIIRLLERRFSVGVVRGVSAS